MKKMSAMVILLLAAGLAAPSAAEESKKEEKKAEKAAQARADIDAMAQQTLDELFEDSPKAKELYDQAAGHAVFSNYKIQFIFAGGGGSGVAVSKDGERTYMKMGTGGVGLGIGAKKYSVVFLFETDLAFRNFVDNGWQADAQAGATAGSADADAEVSFRDGVAYFQISKNGLIASADISGTRFWQSEDLNE